MVYSSKGIPAGISISQMKPQNRKLIDDVLRRIGIPYHTFDDCYKIYNKQIGMYFERFGRSCLEYYIPDYVFELDKEQIAIFLHAFLLGDGYEKGSDMQIYYTSSKRLADGLHELIIKTGRCGTISKRALTGQTKWIKDHCATSSRDGYVVTSSRPSLMKVRPHRVERVHYKGKIYCAEMPDTHLLYTRRNGKCMWSGNSGVPKEVFEAGSGSLAGPRTKVVMMSNPTDVSPDNYFFRSHHKNKRFWTCLHFSGLESPLVDKQWIESVKEEYGEDSAYYSIRVLGEFPTIGDDILIPLHLVDASWGRSINSVGSEAICGVDPARFGDDATGLVIRRGGEIIRVEAWRKHDTMYSAARIADLYSEGLFEWVAIDTIGIGSGVADRLKQFIGANRVVDVNVSERAAAREKYGRLRDELWFASKRFFESLSCSFNTELVSRKMFEEIAAELSSIKYSFLSNGKLKVQSKDDLRKEGRKSPNLADALNLTFVRDVAGELGTVMSASNFSGKAKEIVPPKNRGAVLG